MDLLRNMVCLVGCLVALVGCTPKRVPMVLAPSQATSGAFEGRDGRIAAQFLPYGFEQEQAAFLCGLYAREQLAIEILLQLDPSAGDDSVLSVRSQEIQLVLQDGSSLTPLDPLAVHKSHRIDTTFVAMAAPVWLFVPAIMDEELREQRFQEAVWSEARLSRTQPWAGEFLFFDLSGIDTRRIEAVRLTYDDVSSGRRHTLQVPVEVGLAKPDARSMVPGAAQRKAAWER